MQNCSLRDERNVRQPTWPRLPTFQIVTKGSFTVYLNIMRQIFILAAIISVFMQPLAMNGQTPVKDELKKTMAEINAEMPMQLGSMGTIEAVSLDGDSLVYHINIDFYDNFNIAYPDREIKDISDQIKLGFANMAQTDETFGSFLSYLSANGIWLKGDITFGDKSTQFAISPEEERVILETEPDYKLFVATDIARTKENLPIDMGVMKMVGYDLMGNNVVTTIEVDESQISMANLKSRQSAVKEGIIDLIRTGNEPTTAAIMMNCGMAGYDVVYKYVGNISKDEVSVTVTSSEILSSINQ